MILQQVWNRFTVDWKSFAMLGIGPALASMALSAVLFVLGLITVGTSILAVIWGGHGYSGARVLGMMGGMVVFLLLAMIVVVIGSTLVQGGLVGSVVAYRRGETPGLPAFWAHAKRNFGRFLGLMILTWVSMAVVVIVTSPVIGAVPIIGLPLVVGIQAIVVVNLTVYPAYLMVAEELSVIDAIGTGLRIVTRNIREACLSGMILLGFSAALVCTMILHAIPVVGSLAVLAAIGLYGPVMVYYFAERFEMLVRPSLGGSAQGPA